MSARRFEMSEGGSNKFWEISRDGKSFTVRFGKVGTQGQSKTKELSTDEEARRTVEKLIAEKTGKGYVECSSAEGSAPAPAPSSAAAEPVEKPSASAPKKPRKAASDSANDFDSATLNSVVRKAKNVETFSEQLIDILKRHPSTATPEASARALALLFAKGRLDAQHESAIEALGTLVLAQHAPRSIVTSELVATLLRSTTNPSSDSLFAGYSPASDDLAMIAYGEDRPALEALRQQSEGGARLGLELVRARYGEKPDASHTAAILAGLAGLASRGARLLSRTETGALERVYMDGIESVVSKVGSPSEWSLALSDYLKKNHTGRALPAWLLARLDAATLAEILVTKPNLIDRDRSWMEPLFAAPIDPAVAFATLDGIPPNTSTREGRGLVAAAAALAAKARGIAVPPSFETHFSGIILWNGWPESRRFLAAKMVNAIAATGPDRARAMAANARKATGAAASIDTLLATAAAPDPKSVADLVAAGVQSFPEVVALVLQHAPELVPQGSDDPSRLLRLETAFRLCERGPLETKWLEHIDLANTPRADGVDVWLETRILATFASAVRREHVLRALTTGPNPDHAVLALWTLDEADRVEALRAAIARTNLSVGALFRALQDLGDGVVPTLLAAGVVDHPLVREACASLPPGHREQLAAKTGAASPSRIDRLRQLASGANPAIRIYALEREDRSSGLVRRSGSKSSAFGNGPIADALVPRTGDGARHTHVVTLALDDVPEWRAKFPGVAAVSLFVDSDGQSDGDYSSARVVRVPDGSLGDDPNGVPLVVEPVDVSRDELAKDGPLRGSVAALGGHACATPLWLQDEEAAGDAFLFQLNPRIGGELNLGDDGSLYVFEDGKVVFQSR